MKYVNILLNRYTSTELTNSPEALTNKITLLLFGGYFSLAFSVFQISGVFWPPSAIKYLGGPAELSQTQPIIYALLCIVVAVIVAIFGLYALSGGGKIRRLPLRRTIITLATATYVLRGLLLIAEMPVVIKHPGLMRFALFSGISLCVGLVHLGGLIKLFKQGRPGKAASEA